MDYEKIISDERLFIQKYREKINAQNEELARLGLLLSNAKDAYYGGAPADIVFAKYEARKQNALENGRL